MTMNQQTEGENFKSLKLYNFQNMKASLFFQIMNSQDLTLLSKKKLQNLSPEESERISLEIQDRWIEIQEQYYNATDKTKYNSFISERAFEDSQDREMLIIDACSLLIDFETKYGVKLADYREALSKIGIEGDFNRIVSLIKQKRMKYKLLKLNKEKNDGETAKNDFYDLIAVASQKLGYHIPSDILLIEWCGILNTLKRITDGRSNSKS